MVLALMEGLHDFSTKHTRNAQEAEAQTGWVGILIIYACFYLCGGRLLDIIRQPF